MTTHAAVSKPLGEGGMLAIPQPRRRWTGRARGRAQAVVVAVSLVLLGACSFSIGSGDELDTEKGEGKIRELIQDQADPGTPIGEVSCPDRKAKAGDVFECTAEVDGQTLRIQVTQDDDEGNLSIEQAQAVIDVEETVAFVEENVEGPGGAQVTADCGPRRYLVKDPGSTFDCEVTPTSGGASSRVVLTVEDLGGEVTLSVP